MATRASNNVLVRIQSGNGALTVADTKRTLSFLEDRMHHAPSLLRPLAAGLISVILLASLALPLAAQAAKSEAAKPAPKPLKLKVGSPAPDFSLKYFDGEKLNDISLHDFRGKKSVVLAFYVFAFTGG